MNERIKELIEHATGTGGYFNTEVFDKEKFAELIVEECVNQARSEEDRFYGIGEDDLALVMEHFQVVLKEHFGVEE